MREPARRPGIPCSEELVRQPARHQANQRGNQPASHAANPARQPLGRDRSLSLSLSPPSLVLCLALVYLYLSLSRSLTAYEGDKANKQGRMESEGVQNSNNNDKPPTGSHQCNSGVSNRPSVSPSCTLSRNVRGRCGRHTRWLCVHSKQTASQPSTQAIIQSRSEAS
jgi:hypothetical protein